MERTIMFLDNHPRATVEEVVELLQSLRNGEGVKLGEFGDETSESTPADFQGLLLEDIIEQLREGARLHV